MLLNYLAFIVTLWLLLFFNKQGKTPEMKQTRSAVPTNPSAASLGRDRSEKSEITDIRRFYFVFLELPSLGLWGAKEKEGGPALRAFMFITQGPFESLVNLEGHFPINSTGRWY